VLGNVGFATFGLIAKAFVAEHLAQNTGNPLQDAGR
jgi:hypothetical protein